MRLKDVFDFVDARWGSQHSFQAEQQKNGMREIVKNYGEGFAVFVGASLTYFSGDRRDAIGEARKRVAYGADRSTVSIKSVKV